MAGNEPRTYLARLPSALDHATWAAYGRAGDPAETGDEAILARLLGLNGERAASLAAPPPPPGPVPT